MKRNNPNRKPSVIRRPAFWPDEMYQNNNRFYQQDDSRFAIYGILVAIILILALIIGCQTAKIIEITSRTVDVEAAEIVIEFDSTLADLIEQIDLEQKIVTMPVYPDTADIWMPDMPTGEFKTYMDYRTITRRDSAQYQLQQLAWTDADGFRRYEQYYLIALGTGFGSTIGQTYEITLSGGRVFLGMLGDVKADEHTDKSNRFIEMNGNIVEFIIDRKKMDADVLTGGDVSPLGFEGAIIRVLEVDYE